MFSRIETDTKPVSFRLIISISPVFIVSIGLYLPPYTHVSCDLRNFFFFFPQKMLY